MLSISHLTASVGDKKILKNFSYTFEKGKVYVVMGPNGSGKSTLANAIMNHPGYEYGDKTKITLDGVDVTGEEADARAKAGMFLSFQSPLSLLGISAYQLLQVVMGKDHDPLEVRQRAQKIADELRIPHELLSRSLNEGASGGEKKKLEVLQAAVMDRPLQIFDEIDTGVDVDALKAIGMFLEKHRQDKTYIIITHYNRILRYIKSDHVLVIKEGKLAAKGGHELIEHIEQKGFDQVGEKEKKKRKK